MTITTKVQDQLTGEVYVDNTVEANVTFKNLEHAANIFQKTWPNSTISIKTDEDSFIFLMALNQQEDEVNMEWKDYMNKWYPNAIAW